MDYFLQVYHRFGFLDIAQDEIGIGISDDKKSYTYEMGNNAIAKLCEADYRFIPGGRLPC